MRRIAEKIPEPGISKIWIVACLATNAFSLILCDSNASLVLALGYAIVYMFICSLPTRRDFHLQKLF